VKLPQGEWLHLPEARSTQDVAFAAIAEGRDLALVIADHQTKGRGRLGRTWQSGPGDSLTMSLLMTPYPDHPRPWLLAMAVAAAFAETIGCELLWPNDLVGRGRKLGGVLTELCHSPYGSIAVIGVGINLRQENFPPEISHRATSLALEYGAAPFAEDLLRSAWNLLELMPDPQSWKDVEPYWAVRDATPGKPYRSGEEEGIARGIDPQGALIIESGGRLQTVFAADAWFGPETHAPQKLEERGARTR
jgi:BirA family transcriptional regulator, biotin operon repressor / biotin---[acetyl-CoA-carboxylase] ligase